MGLLLGWNGNLQPCKPVCGYDLSPLFYSPVVNNSAPVSLVYWQDRLRWTLSGRSEQHVRNGVLR